MTSEMKSDVKGKAQDEELAPETTIQKETIELTEEEENQIKQELIDQLNQETLKKVDETIEVIKNDPEVAIVVNKEAPKKQPGRLKKLVAIVMALAFTGGPAGWFLKQKLEKPDKEPGKVDTRSMGRDAQKASRIMLESRDDTEAGKERQFKEREERLMLFTSDFPNHPDYVPKADCPDNVLKSIWEKPLNQLTPAEIKVLRTQSKTLYLRAEGRYRNVYSKGKLEAWQAYRKFIDSGGKDRPSPPAHDGSKTISDLWMQEAGFASDNPYWPRYKDISLTTGEMVRGSVEK